VIDINILLVTTPYVFGRFNSSLLRRGAAESEVAGRGFFAIKAIRKTPSSPFPKQGIAHPNPLFSIYRTPVVTTPTKAKVLVLIFLIKFYCNNLLN
jgi:hypothetical protein